MFLNRYIPSATSPLHWVFPGSSLHGATVLVDWPTLVAISGSQRASDTHFSDPLLYGDLNFSVGNLGILGKKIEPFSHVPYHPSRHSQLKWQRMDSMDIVNSQSVK